MWNRIFQKGAVFLEGGIADTHTTTSTFSACFEERDSNFEPYNCKKETLIPRVIKMTQPKFCGNPKTRNPL